jgi:hypothetical protein
MLQKENGLPIKSWMGEDSSDRELPKISKLLGNSKEIQHLLSINSVLHDKFRKNKQMN